MPSGIAPVALSLSELVGDFALAIQTVDARHPIARSARSGASYQPGIGPHSEAKTVELVLNELKSKAAATYAGASLNSPSVAGFRGNSLILAPARARGRKAIEEASSRECV